MNPENEEQKAVPQTLCGALQKEANCKCLVLSVLIYGCLAAVTWCRCANVTKIVINFSTFPIKSTKYVSPCDDGYIYIPVAFMGMLYLVYLVECYHSPIRIDLLHAEDQSSSLAKLIQLKLAQPSIWWKAISYHYVRRKRQVMRYRNGDNFTTTQVYYERVNSHAATSFYFYDYCGSKDISKELILDPKMPITKITLSKGFAFSNVRSATEFEEARSRFFTEQEFRDDFMEMREGLDLGCNFSPVTLVAVLGNPWFTRSYVYWCLSALLLSWPLRIIIECKTQYVDYQITKLFGVNYDTPTNIQIHTSASQLSAPGSYMLAPSYSEALLMEPSVPSNTAQPVNPADTPAELSALVPSYSEALLYERASAEHQPGGKTSCSHEGPLPQYKHTPIGLGLVCECPCHSIVEHRQSVEFTSQGSLQIAEACAVIGTNENEINSSIDTSQRKQRLGRLNSNENHHHHHHQQQQQQQDDNSSNVVSYTINTLRPEGRICDNCLSTDAASERRARRSMGRELIELIQPRTPVLERRIYILREHSEPDLRRSAEMLSENALAFLRANGRSLANIMENEETDNPLSLRAASERAEALVLDDMIRQPSSPPQQQQQQHQQQQQQQQQPSRSTGAIPKRTSLIEPINNPPISSSSSTGSSNNNNSSSASNSRVTVNPIAEAVKRLPNSRSTYFCLKSILKQNRRRFTLVTPEELQSLTREDLGVAGSSSSSSSSSGDGVGGTGGEEEVEEECDCVGCRSEVTRPMSLRIDKQHRQISCQSLNYRRENSRTLIFASPIQEICPLDPFGGRNRVSSENPPPRYEEAINLPVLSRIRRSLTERNDTSSTPASTSSISNEGSSSTSSTSAKATKIWKHRRSNGNDSQLPSSSSSDNTRTGLISNSETGRNTERAISIPSCNGITMPPDSCSTAGQSSADERCPFLGHDELAAASTSNDDMVLGFSEIVGERTRSRLTRSLTERRSKPDLRRQDRHLRKSFTERIDTGVRVAGIKRTNINIETSL